MAKSPKKYVTLPSNRPTATLITKAVQAFFYEEQHRSDFPEIYRITKKWENLNMKKRPLPQKLAFWVGQLPELDAQIRFEGDPKGPKGLFKIHMEQNFYHDLTFDNGPTDSESEGYESNTDGEKYKNVPTTIIEENEEQEKSSTGSEYDNVTAVEETNEKNAEESNEDVNASNTSISPDHDNLDDNYKKNAVESENDKGILHGDVKEPKSKESISEREKDNDNEKFVFPPENVTVSANDNVTGDGNEIFLILILTPNAKTTSRVGRNMILHPKKKIKTILHQRK